MTYYALSTSIWDSSDTFNARQCSGRVLSDLIGAIPTATTTNIVVSFIKEALQKRTPAGDNLTLFTMRQSQEAFAQIWNDPEEDIWDEL